MHAGTEMRKPIDAFCNCMTAPKNQLITQMCHDVINTQYYEYVSCILALVLQHANHIFSVPYYIAICGLSGCTISFCITL